MIAQHEAAHGPVPVSVREWYLVPNVVLLDYPDESEPHHFGAGTLWHDYLPHDMGNRYHVSTLADVLHRVGTIRRNMTEPFVVVLNAWGYYTWRWLLNLDGSDDPPVRIDPQAMADDPVK